MLDGFHMAIEERDFEKAIISVGDKLIHVQVSENYRGTPGTGQTPWDSFKRGLPKINYDGVVSIESFTPEIKGLLELCASGKISPVVRMSLPQRGFLF